MIVVDGGGRYARVSPTSWPAVIAPDAYAAAWGVADTEEPQPVLYAVVRTSPRVKTVRLAADGHQDTALVVDGLAVTAVRLSSARSTPVGRADLGKVELVGRDALGWVVDRRTLDDEPEPLPAWCEAPAPLPAAGAEQPSDPTAAAAAVREAFVLRWPEAQVGEVVFVSPLQAAVAFRLPQPAGHRSLGNRLGHAAFTDGRWEVLRSTVCDVLAAQGVACEST
jgi:hypothetical protein